MQDLFNKDCMPDLSSYPDNYFGLAIVDPPYYSGEIERRGYYGHQESSIGVKRIDYPKGEKWDVPDKKYFDQLFRISRKQIIWGVNYFTDIYPFGPGRIVWNKHKPNNISFSDCEIAYCSEHRTVRIFDYIWNGMIQGKSIAEGHLGQGNKKLNEKRIHPAQKPVNLYIWCLQQYAKPGDIILDTHVGSASSLIACEELGFDYIGYEIDEEYYNLAVERLGKNRQQLRLEI